MKTYTMEHRCDLQWAGLVFMHAMSLDATVNFASLLAAFWTLFRVPMAFSALEGTRARENAYRARPCGMTKCR